MALVGKVNGKEIWVAFEGKMCFVVEGKEFESKKEAIAFCKK